MRLLLSLGFAATLAAAGEFPKPFNTGTDVGKKPMPAEEAVKLIEMPPGFKATVFASEPDVQNPIACAWDSRGRLWVAENYTYADAKTNFDKTLRDRILIFEDTDNDGKADKRTVFADNLQNLTSLELGYGGVFVTAAPNLLFIPDRDHDDKPDALPAAGEKSAAGGTKVLLPGTSYEILLDGFDAGPVRHNIVNGLKWGPDGWLYGRHGILATSNVGRPGASDAERVKFNCAIWRYHPTAGKVEVVTWGGTNAWGHDWTEDGTGFFVNTVIGHLYQIIPGAHYERMYGEDLNPYIYKLLPQTADHYHFDTSKSWTESRDGKANDFGGGHAHSGCMIYYGENWPAQYRGKLFTLNLHGRRINVERLEMQGSSYVAKAEPDMIFFKDPWFRGVELTYGPDGGVYVLDWSDDGECHESDGVHRESGRIYKITYGEVKKGDLGPKGDLAALSKLELLPRIFGADEWTTRIALQVYMDKLFFTPDTAEEKEPLATALFKAMKADPRAEQTKSAPNYRQTWKFLRVGGGVLKPKDPPNWNDEQVRLYRTAVADLLSEAQMRLTVATDPQRQRANVDLITMEKILQYPEDNRDRVLPHLYWSRFEPLVGHEDDAVSTAAVKAALIGKIDLVREFAARKIAQFAMKRPARFEELLRLASEHFDETSAPSLLRGISAGLGGAQHLSKPATWDTFAAKAAQIPALANDLRQLNILFGDGRALDEVRAVALDGKASLPARRQAVATLIASKDAELRPVCEKLASNPDLALEAIRGLATFDDQKAAARAVESYAKVRDSERPAAIGAYCSQPRAARALLAAVAKGRIARADLTPYHARQIAALAESAKDPDLATALKTVWGEVRTTPEDKQRRIAAFRKQLTPELLAQADLAQGRAVFTQTCAACHTLFDLGQTGANLGPNLTGSGRTDLGYLLENIVDPSALVPADYKMSVLSLKDGRVLSGFISRQTEQAITLRTMTDTQTVSRADVTKIETSPQSLMPEGLLESLSPGQLRDLCGFLLRK